MEALGKTLVPQVELQIFSRVLNIEHVVHEISESQRLSIDVSVVVSNVDLECEPIHIPDKFFRL